MMPVTIDVNGLTIAHKGTAGFEKCSAPDVCKTLAPPSPSPVPVPYTIISFNTGLIRGSRTVKADGGNSIDILGSAHTPCIGDEPGTLGGVISGTNVHESTWITYSPTVFIEGKNVCRQSDKMFMNNKNTISGSGGNWEPPLIPGTPVATELSRISDAINSDGNGQEGARTKAAARSSDTLKSATKAQYGDDATARVSPPILHPTQKPIAGSQSRPQVNWADRMEDLASRQQAAILKKARMSGGGKNQLEDVRREWTQFRDTDIQRLGDLADQGYDIYEVRPDVVIETAGRPEAIYDFGTGDDSWQPGRKELYDDILGGQGRGATQIVGQKRTT